MLERAALLIVIATRRRDYMHARHEIVLRGEESRLYFNELSRLLGDAAKLVLLAINAPLSLPSRAELDLLVPAVGDLIAPPRDA